MRRSRMLVPASLLIVAVSCGDMDPTDEPTTVERSSALEIDEESPPAAEAPSEAGAPTCAGVYDLGSCGSCGNFCAQRGGTEVDCHQFIFLQIYVHNYCTCSFDRPAAPVAVAPEGQITDTTPVYKWHPSPRTTKYRVRALQGTTVVVDKWVGSSVCANGVCKTSTATAQPLSRYVWHVQSYRELPNASGGCYGRWSDSLHYTIVEP